LLLLVVLLLAVTVVPSTTRELSPPPPVVVVFFTSSPVIALVLFALVVAFMCVRERRFEEKNLKFKRERENVLGFHLASTSRKKKKKTEIACDKRERKKARTFWVLCARAKEREREREMSSGAMTRAHKRRIGQRDLWDTIVNNDDVCFKHILPRLNQTDVKFLFEVNSETRALIKRSSRVGELEKRFKVKEMSSISTLEFAWENRSLWWSYWMNGQPFCSEVAQTNKLELLKWIREEKHCDWDQDTIHAAAEQGNLEMLKYCVANKCPMNEETCAYAAIGGELECLKYLHEQVKAPWDSHTAVVAGLSGYLHILEYLVEKKYDKFDEGACRCAAKYGHLDCLKYLRETAKAPWNSDAVRTAHRNNHTECLQYLLDNDCPLPWRWRYEDGTLYTN